MYTTLVFLALCAVEFVFIWWKWSDINDYKEVGQTVASVTGIDKNVRYSAFVRISGNILSKFKVLLVIPLAILIFANFIASLILGGILAIFF